MSGYAKAKARQYIDFTLKSNDIPADFDVKKEGEEKSQFDKFCDTINETLQSDFDAELNGIYYDIDESEFDLELEFNVTVSARYSEDSDGYYEISDEFEVEEGYGFLSEKEIDDKFKESFLHDLNFVIKEYGIEFKEIIKTNFNEIEVSNSDYDDFERDEDEPDYDYEAWRERY